MADDMMFGFAARLLLGALMVGAVCILAFGIIIGHLLK